MMPSQSVRELFEQDHDRLDGLFMSFQTLKRTDVGKAAQAFEAFRAGLERHILWEEELLFPLWEQKTGLVESGPTVVMRAEHRHIHQCLERIREAVAAQHAGSEEAERVLLDLLCSHNMKEERVLYPAIDQAISDEERAGIFEAIKSQQESTVREER